MILLVLVNRMITLSVLTRHDELHLKLEAEKKDNAVQGHKVIHHFLYSMAMVLFISGNAHAGLLKNIVKRGALAYGGSVAYKAYAEGTRPSDAVAADCTPGLKASREHIARIVSQRQLVKNLPVPPISGLHDPNTYVIFIAFDGTGNHGEQFVPIGADGLNWPAPRYSRDECIEKIRQAKNEVGSLIYTTLPSNPRILYTLSRTSGSKIVKPLYIRGVGTDPNLNIFKPFENLVDKGTGNGMVSMVNDALKQLGETVSSIAANSDEFHVAIATTGFSRGAAAARIFHNKLLEVGIHSPDGTLLVPPEAVNIAGSVLFDTVSTHELIDIGNSNFDIPPSIPFVLHLVADHEYRKTFKLHSATGDNVIEVGFPGAHSDIGGTYRTDGISAVTLDASIAVLKKLGIEFNELHRDFTPKAKNYIIHDSRWYPIGKFTEQIKKPRERLFESPGERQQIPPNQTSLQMGTDAIVFPTTEKN